VKAVSTAGFVAVSLARAIASGGAPASRLLKCSSTPDLIRSEGNADSFLYLTPFLPFAPFIVTHCSLGYRRWSDWGSYCSAS
jgi:hypothetical protein